MTRRPIVQGDELGRRMRAARALADITVEELTARIDEPGLGYGTLGNLERGTRILRRMEVPVLAAGLGVPPAWFWVDIPAAVAEYGERP